MADVILVCGHEINRTDEGWYIKQTEDVEFDFRHNGGSPWHPVHVGTDYNPNCDLALRIDGTWIPGEITYFEVAEVNFLNELLRVLIGLKSGETQEASSASHTSERLKSSISPLASCTLWT